MVVRLHGSTLRLYNDRKEPKFFHELPLQSSYCLSDVVLQQYDIYGKIHTAKLQVVKYQVRRCATRLQAAVDQVGIPRREI